MLQTETMLVFVLNLASQSQGQLYSHDFILTELSKALESCLNIMKQIITMNLFCLLLNQRIMRYLSYTKSHCWTNIPMRFSARCSRLY